MNRIKQDEQWNRAKKLYEAGELSPKVWKFVEGLNNGSAGVDWALLGAGGLAMGDGSFFRIIGTNRNYEQQVTEYKRGRTVELKKISDSKGYRYEVLKSVLVNPSAKSTDAMGGYSYHNYGCAVDIVFRKLGDSFGRSSPVTVGDTTYNNLKEFYTDCGLLEWANACGLDWGGDFVRIWDLAHFEDALALPSLPFDYMCHYSFVAGGVSAGGDLATGTDIKNAGSSSRGTFAVVVACLLGLGLFFFGTRGSK